MKALHDANYFINQSPRVTAGQLENSLAVDPSSHREVRKRSVLQQTEKVIKPV
jgi:hypothetical protein